MGKGMYPRPAEVNAADHVDAATCRRWAFVYAFRLGQGSFERVAV